MVQLHAWIEILYWHSSTSEILGLLILIIQKIKMKKILMALLMICFTTGSFAQTSSQKDKTQIRDLITNSFDQIWSELNSKNIDKYYTKDFLLFENGEVWNNDSIRIYLDQAILKKPIRKRVNTIEIIEVKVFKERAWIAYRHQANFSMDHNTVRKAQWLESATAILTDKGWRLEMLHSTVIKNE